MRRPDLLRALAAAAVGVLLFLPVLRADFVSDDRVIIAYDPRVHDLANIPSFFRQEYWGNLVERSFNYRPLTLTLFALEWRAFGENPVPYHAVSLVAYALACMGVYVLARRLGLEERAAFGAACLFAVIPAHAESVSVLFAQAELFAGALVLATLILHLDDGRPAASGALAAVALHVALFFKETAYAAVLLVPALDLALGRRLEPRRYVPLACSLAVYFALKYAAMGAEGFTDVARNRGDSGLMMVGAEPGERLLAMVRGYAHVVRRLVSPFDLAPSYDGDARRLISAPLAAADLARAALAAAALAGAAVLWRRDRRGLAALAIFLGSLAPTLNPAFIYLTDRGLLLASVGAAIGAALALDALAGRSRGLAAGIALAVLIAFGAASAVATRAYRDQISLWARAAAYDPGAWFAWWNLAFAQYTEGRLDPADAAAARGLELKPDSVELLDLRGVIALRRGEPEAAVAVLERALAIGGDRLPSVAHNLAGAYRALGRDDLAEAALERAARARERARAVGVEQRRERP